MPKLGMEEIRRKASIELVERAVFRALDRADA